MTSRSKTNNFIALLIAAILFAAGFAMYFIHEKMESEEQLGQLQTCEKLVAGNIPSVETALRMDLPPGHT